MSGFPVQSAKVQRPPLRDDVLARDRLLDWLHAKIHHRLILILAEAGYGKTTLLADFARRTRLRTLWYRMDEDDRDWVTLLHHLVASGREHDPAFAPRTAAMLSDTEVSGPSRETVLETFLRELPSIAEHGAVVILDDFHLVDDAQDARLVVRELVLRAPERVSIVIASRRAPSIAIAKLRAAGEVVELRTDDLRFDQAETARLFSETYGRTLEPDVLAELSARTEGWAASLQLVQAALRDRSPLEIRRFVRNLTGADHELYDYLAEEVVGDLPDDLQRFLMETSILQVVTPELAEAATGLTASDVRRLTSLAERFSLLSRRGTQQRDHLRYHPLVRDFLESRLERGADGRNTVTALHRKIAEATEAHDWRTACHHYSEIADQAAIGRVIDSSVREILARGDSGVADGYLRELADTSLTTNQAVIRSRMEYRRGEASAAFDWAQAIFRRDPTSTLALANVANLAFSIGRVGIAQSAAQQLAASPSSDDLSVIGANLAALTQVSLDGNIRSAIESLDGLQKLQQARGHQHHESVTLLNRAMLEKARGGAEAALAATDRALDLLERNSDSPEFTSVRMARAWALAHLGQLSSARDVIADTMRDAIGQSRLEALSEAAEIEVWYGSAQLAVDFVSRAMADIAHYPQVEPGLLPVRAQLALRQRDLALAQQVTSLFRIGELSQYLANQAQQLAVQSYSSFLNQDPTAHGTAQRAFQLATRQGAQFWVDYVALLRSAYLSSDDLNRELRRVAADCRSMLSVHAELLVDSLSEIDDGGYRELLTEMRSRPERWHPPLREAIASGSPNALRAAIALDEIGTPDDVDRLRRFSRATKTPGTARLGRNLARRVAQPVYVEDQGRVALRIGTRHVEGTGIRRKVLALLCYLLTRPRFSANRDEVLDALWPDFEPLVALNSLNQTVYFLRRVFEPNYVEDRSPGYVRHESDVVWLDRQLVSSRSQVCTDYIRSLTPRPMPDEVAQLVAMYNAPFALDFAYEEWAVGYRESLHAAYLQVVENAIAGDIATGHFDRGIVLARRALAVDPGADQIEVSLLRLLRLSGAHAAAAEQYAHYSEVMRDSLGVEPPPLDAL